MKFIFAVFIFVVVATNADAKKRCYPLPTPVADDPPVLPPAPICKKAHESYTTCGTACPLSCEKPTPGICTKQCVKGCFCDAGYVRDNKGNCILVEECPKPKCGKHETYSDCGGSPCQATCENPFLPQTCKAACKPGCGCDKKYVRDNNGNCVLLRKCPNRVPSPVVLKTCKKEHESYTTCGTACPLTCEKPILWGCSKQCVKGCFCDAGYVRDNKGNCILVEECPKPKCGKHENYNDCGGTICQPTCENPNFHKTCRAACKPGCGCNEGYVRDNDGNCILLKKCPQTLKCEKNEFYEACSTLCGEPTCENSRAFYCGAGCEPKCLCKKGYVRNAENKCIKSENCPAKCKPFEIFSDCAPEACKKTCDTLNTACKAPCVPGCKCPEGQVYLDDNRDKCVSPKKCPTIVVDPPVCSGKHESYSECGAYCQRTCGPPTPCARPSQDCNPGCVCDAGYVRETHGGKCILSKKCPK